MSPRTAGQVDVSHYLALLGRALHLVLCAHLGLEGEEEHLKVALLHELWWFLSVIVSVEMAQLLLNFTEGVGELFVAESSGDGLDLGKPLP